VREPNAAGAFVGFLLFSSHHTPRVVILIPVAHLLSQRNTCAKDAGEAAAAKEGGKD
jgi:hypothetical protein